MSRNKRPEPPIVYEIGTPNDPKVQFDNLRATLTLVKEELSPWSWQSYADEFRDRQKADKKLQALNKLPGSGVEPSDGVVQGTPVWMERLDKMLLVEHLKTKVMQAHQAFGDASELLMRAHGLLVKDNLLADRFLDSITHVPPAQAERVDILHQKLLKCRKEKEDLENEFEDFKETLQRNRVKWVQRLIDHQTIQIARKRCDDTVVSWSYQAQKGMAQRFGRYREVLEARVKALETSLAARTDEVEENQRQAELAFADMTADRDNYKHLYTKMVKAHEQALEDLKNAGDSVEAKEQMIKVLSTEKARLTEEKEGLEEDKRRLVAQVADLREETNRQKEELRRFGALMRGTEVYLFGTRQRLATLESSEKVLQTLLSEAAVMEAQLREDLAMARLSISAGQARAADLQELLDVEIALHTGASAERDFLVAKVRDMDADAVQKAYESKDREEKTKAQAKADIENFRRTELARVEKEAQAKTEKLERRNDLLEREVKLSDDLGPSFKTLNPLPVDASRVCRICRRAIVFEGPVKEPPPKEPAKG